jgi:hypothetical protein
MGSSHGQEVLVSVFSTDTCLIHLTDCIKFEIDKGSIVCMILLDVQKAFDTVDLTILHMKKFFFFFFFFFFMKLLAFAINNDFITWFKSYF